jgi:DNA-binding NtrC family response regulator
MDDGSRQAGGRRMLVVEDNEDFRLLLELTLRDEGYSVDAVPSAEDAIPLLDAHSYALVLSDYSLPARSGAWLLSQLAARHHGREVPFVIITGDADAPGIPRDALVVSKPVDFDRLLGDIRHMLSDRRGRLSARVRMHSQNDEASPGPSPA